MVSLIECSIYGVVQKIIPAGILCFFYRATLCISAVFDVARCPSVRLSVCLSVCLSVTFVYSIQKAEDRQTSFSVRQPIILVSHALCL